MKNYEHPIIAALVCLAIMLAGLPGLLCLAPAAVFAGREHAQAEYRWIERFGHGVRANMPWWGGFDPKVWDTHSALLNLSIPALIGAIAWGFL